MFSGGTSVNVISARRPEGISAHLAQTLGKVTEDMLALNQSLFCCGGGRSFVLRRAAGRHGDAEV